ncbi:Cna B-type domain-containing protein, partial [Peptostreptococcus canis]
GEDIEITPIYGKLGNETIIAGYEKKKRENPTGPRKIQNVEGDLTEDDELLAEIKPVNLRLAGDELSLDNVRIISFKIIEVSRGDREIDYRVSDNQPEFDNFSNDPTKFSNAICEDGKFSKLKLELSMEYNGTNPIKEGDILNIPANLEQALASFSEQALFDGTNHQLGTWEYKRGVISIKFGGDYIKNNQITKVTASFKTGDIAGYLNAYGQTFNKGERVAARGKIGKNDFVAAWEKEHVQASVVGKTDRHMSKGGSGTDKNINWYYSVFTDIANISGKEYYCPFLLENNGKYTAKALTRLYIEDTFHDVIAPPNLSKDSSIILSGINDAGEVISGWYSINLPSSLLTKVEQGARTRDEVKQALKAGEYCIYNNKDETYTLMLKWWDTNDSNGLTYDQIPSIKSAGGVGNLLKTRYKSIFGNVSDETITRINNLYKGKAIQNFRIYADAKYTPVKEVTKIPNTLKITSDQGDFNIKGVATLTPPVGIADAPADPLTIKLIKTDVKTGANLSDGFKFKLQTSTDDGVTWKDVNVIQDMVEKGTLNGDGTLSPDKGEVQVRRLIGGQKYRFLETSHAEGYMDVAENNANPNDAKHPTSANSRVVDINNQGKGKVVVMYNKRISEKIEIHVNKEWVGPKSNSVTIKLIADGKEVPGKILVLNNDNNWRGKFTDIEKNNDNGDEIQYDVAEVKLQNYDSKKEGNAKTGFTITNKNIEKISIPVEKKWEGEELD